MKKLYYLLLLSLFTSFILMSNDQENKNKVLAQQLSTINTQFQKWKKELEVYKKWALENDGVLSAEEQAEIERRQKDMDAILARVAQIVKAKGLLAFMGLPTKEETKATVEIEEKEIMPTETTLERPDPLKSVAALDNEEAMGMLEDNIPKGDFIEFCKQKLSSSNIAKAIKAVKDPKAKVNMDALSKKVANLSFETPLGKELHAKMKEALAKLSNESSAQEVIREFSSIASNYTDEKALETHFKNNKAFYNYDPESRKKKENTPVVANQNELNPAQLEVDIDNFLSIAGELLYSPEVVAEHPENLKKQEEEKKKLEEEKKKLEEEKKKAEAEKAAEEASKKAYFREVLLREKQLQNSELDAIATAGDTAGFELKIVSIRKIEEKKGEVNAANGAAALAWDEIYKSVYNFIKNNATLVTVSECKNYVQSLLLEYGKPAQIDRLYEAYLLDENLSNFPTGLADWINSSSEAANLETFVVNFKEKWKNVVYAAVDGFEADLSKKGISAKATRSAIVQNFKLILSRPLHQTAKQPGLDIASIFERYLPAGTIISFGNVDTAWKNTLDYCSEKKFLADLCEKTIVKESKSLDDIVDAIDSIPNVLPSVSAISTALQNSIYWPKQSKLSDKADTFKVSTSINIQYLSENVGQLIVPLIPGGGAIPGLDKGVQKLTEYLANLSNMPAKVNFDLKMFLHQRKSESGKEWAFATISPEVKIDDVVGYNLEGFDLKVVSIVSEVNESSKDFKAETSIRVRFTFETSTYSLSVGASAVVGAEYSRELGMATKSFDLVFYLLSEYDPTSNTISVSLSKFNPIKHDFVKKSEVFKPAQLKMKAFE